MPFLSAKAFFEDGTPGVTMLLIRAKTEIPDEFIRLYKKNVVQLTPIKSGRLRRSIITQSLGGEANISWRAPYAAAINQGFHTVYEKRVVNINGRFVTLQPGIYRHKSYPGGGGPRFANIAFQRTQAQMPAALKARGLTP